MTAVTVQITDENLAFLNRQVKNGWYKDQATIFNELISSAREIEKINERMEKHVQRFLERGEKPPVPYANSPEDEQRLLEEAVNSGEATEWTSQEWVDMRTELHARYRDHKRKQQLV